MTDNTGATLWSLWNATDRGAPIPMTTAALKVAPVLLGDIDGNGAVDAQDLTELLNAWGSHDSPADLNGDRTVDAQDLAHLLARWTG